MEQDKKKGPVVLGLALLALAACLVLGLAGERPRAAAAAAMSPLELPKQATA